MATLFSNLKVKKLVEKYKQIVLLGNTRAILEWDTNVNLPPKGSSGRAEQVGLLTELITNVWNEAEFRSLLEELQQKTDSLRETERAVVRNLVQVSKYYYRVPKEIIVKKSKLTSEAFMVWQEAKKQDKFSDFLPYLSEIISLDQVIAQHLGFKKNPYDALLDQFEPQLTAQSCESIFSQLQGKLAVIIRKIKSSKSYSESNELIDGPLFYPEDAQRQLNLFILRRMNYDLSSGRMDISAHPFTTTLDRFDVRITTWYHQHDFRESLMATMHEAGHGLYEQGVDEEYQLTPLDGGVSLAIHESQSRFWENRVGRSPAFLRFLIPVLQAFYPDQLGQVGESQILQTFNQVKPSLIRVKADEVTYNLHIILRFELENNLINGKIKAKDLPLVWREKMKKLLGVEPKTDREGVLQDVHWSYGSIGYFPTYALGNLYSAQMTARMRKELKIDDLLAKGELGTILSWLRTNVHQHGSLYWPKELINKIMGKKLDPKYFIDYITDKYSQIYSFKV